MEICRAVFGTQVPAAQWLLNWWQPQVYLGRWVLH